MTKFAIIAANRIKTEPLKGKTQGKEWYAKHFDSDIRSAVEWAKIQIKDWDDQANEILHILDKAFEDVMK